MTKAKTLLALAMGFASTNLLAQSTEPVTVTPGFFEGPNFMLALMALVLLLAIIAAAGILHSLTSNSTYFAKLRKMANDNSLKSIPLMVLAAGSAHQAFAQAMEVPDYPSFFRDQNTLMLLGLNILLLFSFLYLISLIRRTIALLLPAAAAVEVAKVEKEESQIMAILTDAVPVEQEHEIIMDHEYDGIHELDNNLPPWWVWMFYATIVFAFAYMIWYHVLPYGENQHEQYVAELLQAEEEKAAYVALRGEMVDESNVEFLADAKDLKAGRSIFMEHCQTCHAVDGGGGVGPNLTDEYWIHGGSIQQLFGVVKYGVPAKGMISWQGQLRPKEMAQVASYIKTLTGTAPAAPKEPQGEIWPDPNEIKANGDASDTEENDEQGGEADDTNPAETSAATAQVQ